MFSQSDIYVVYLQIAAASSQIWLLFFFHNTTYVNKINPPAADNNNCTTTPADDPDGSFSRKSNYQFLFFKGPDYYVSCILINRDYLAWLPTVCQISTGLQDPVSL